MTVLTNLRIWDGESDQLQQGADALEIIDGKIVRVGPRSEIHGQDERDMDGLFVIPGLIDAHVHLCLNPEIMKPADQDLVSDEELLAQMKVRARAMLAAGITSARDLGGGRWLELVVRDEILAGTIAGPRLICAGQPITSVKGHCHFWGGEAGDLADALTVLGRQVEHGVDLIKVMATGGQLTPDSQPIDAQFDAATLTEIVRTANSRQLTVAAHCHGTSGIRNAAVAGVTTIEHCSWVGQDGWAKNYEADVCEMIAARGIRVSPTVNLGWKRRIGSGAYEAQVRSNFAKMRAAGVALIASTDAGIPNVFHHDLPKALPVFAHFAGLGNVEVLRAATSECARAIGLGKVTGLIAPGYAADLVMFEQNPLEDLAVLETPAAIYARGLAFRK